MAQFRKDTHQYLPDGKTIFEAIMLADQYGNLVGAANPTGMAVDAFGRARVSTPLTLFDSYHRYDPNQKFHTANTSGGTYSFNANSAAFSMTVDTTSGAQVIRESKRVFAYQPGKALRNGEPVLTPTGWVSIESLQSGDLVFDGLGNITKVTDVFPQGLRKIYRFTFDDGTTIDADEEHLWVTIIRNNGKKGKKGEKRILTTKQMLDEQGNTPSVQNRWRIPCSPVLKYEHRKIDIDPYTLGLILGDGHITERGYVEYTTIDEELLDYIKCKQITKRSGKMKYGILGLHEELCDYRLNGTLFDNKFIPEVYKFNSEEVRLNLLRGLMDTDGWIEKDKCTYFASGSKQLAEDVAFLVRSLGGTAKIKTKETTFYTNSEGVRVECSPSYKVVVIIPVNPFRLKRKADKWRLKYRTSFDRYIYSIEELGNYEATCIRVESEDKTFITKNHIVTHNSLQILQTFIMNPAKEGLRQRTGYFDANNGIFLELNGSTLSFVKRSNSTSTPTDNVVNQADWNMDTLDGTGPSGLTLDITKGQIMFIDVEWLGLGTVRCGFVINGQLIHCHSFHHANIIDGPYMTTACLPIRLEITNTTETANSSTLRQVCSSVISEGGYQLSGKPRSVGTPANSVIDMATAGVWYPVVSIRLKADQLDSIVVPTNISFLAEGNNGRAKYALISDGTLGGNTTFVSAASDSPVEYNITANSISGGTVIQQGLVGITNQTAAMITLGKDTLFKYQLSRNGLTNTPEILTLAGMPGTSGDDVSGTIDWEEIT